MCIQAIKAASLLFCVSLLTACAGGLFDKDNTPTPTPLRPVTSEVTPHQLWSTKTGIGAGDDYLKMNPAFTSTTIFTTSHRGRITATDKATGHTNWQLDTQLEIIAGPGAGDGIVVFGTHRGQVIALDQATGKQRWQTAILGEIIAQPAVRDEVVIIKTVDGTVRALSVNSGKEQWSFTQTEPNLVLRGTSTPLIRDHSVFVGFASGALVRLNSNNGDLYWRQMMATPEGAFAVQRMIDIDADPVVYGHHIYAATYQGRINSLNWSSGDILWTHDISSYTGMDVNDDNVYISDAQSIVWSFDSHDGMVKWRQDQLAARNISGPAIMGPYLVVGDQKGYLHWLNRTDGHLAARVSLGYSIFATPHVENGVLYAFTNNGYLVAYKL